MNARRRNSAVVAVLLLVGAVIGWRVLRHGDGGPAAKKDTKGASGLARARAERKAGTADTRPAEVGGRVIDQDGKPIPGAVVAIAMRNLSRGERSDPGTSPEPLTDTTDADGRWHAGALRPGRYTVSASARGHLPAVIDPLVLGPAERRGDVDLTLRRGGHTLHGMVSDIGGGPVAGALVRATSIGDGNLFQLFRAPFSALSGPDGRYELTLADGAYLLEAMHIDYVGNARPTEMRGADRVEDFTLTPGAVVSGVVRMRSTDETVAGATVTRKGGDGPGEGRGGLDLGAMGLSGATTDAQGAFTLRGLGPGTAEIDAFGPGYASRQPAEVEVGIGEEVSGVVVYVDRAYTISGFVVDKRDHDHGIGGVMVAAYNFSGQIHMARDSTAEDGYFEIHGVQNGNYFVGAGGEERVVAAMAQNVTVSDADVTDVVIELDAGATLAGRVDPPSAARIGLDVDPETIGLGNIAQVVGAVAATVRAADDGTFALKGVPDGSFTLVAHSDDGGEGRLKVEVVGGADQTSLVVRVEARARITGTVVDPGGRPVEGVKVEARGDSGPSGILEGMSELWGRGHGLTRGDGTFEVIGLKPGLFHVKVKDDKGDLAWADPEHAKDRDKPIDVTIEGTTPVTGLRLVVETRDGVIGGTVVGPDGAPVPDAWVTARLGMDLTGSGGNGRGGRGERRRRAQEEAKRGKDDAAAEEESHHQVTITVGGSGSNVASEEGTKEELDEAEARRNSRYGPTETPVLTGPDGRFEIRGLREATYAIEAEGLKGTARGMVESIKSGATGVVIKLESLAGIAGRVTFAGQPVTAYTIEAQGPMSRRRAVVDPEGTYRLSRLEAGTYKLSVVSPKGNTTGTVKVAANQVARRDLALVPYGSVRGVLVDATTGEPMPGLPVVAFSDEGSDLGEYAMNILSGDGPKTDAEGRFRVGQLGSGKANLFVLDGDQTSFSMVAQQQFTLAAGQDLDLGTIRGQRSPSVPVAERGDVGMDMTAATFTARPRAPGGDDFDPPSGDTAETRYLWVSAVTTGGAAAAAGVAVGDRVVAIGGVDVAAIGIDMAEGLLDARKVKIGQPIPLVLDSAGHTRTVTVVPTAPPAKP